jgi:hypothetical protein
MNAPNDNAAAKRLREWWASPPRSGMQRLINPWEYRHLRVFGVTRFAGGSVAAAAGVVCLSCAVYGWAAFFLVLGALNLAGGYWYITIARSAPPRAYSATSRPSWRSSATKPATNLIWASVFGLLAVSKTATPGSIPGSPVAMPAGFRARLRPESRPGGLAG